MIWLQRGLEGKTKVDAHHALDPLSKAVDSIHHTNLLENVGVDFKRSNGK